jgi:hypothetical protein
MLDESTRKRLTEDLLHETWYDPERSYTAGGMFKRSPLRTVELKNRTFSTPGDAQDLKDALVKAGKWDEFYLYAIGRFGECQGNYRQFYFGEDFTNWLLSDIPRFCGLVAEWVQERGSEMDPEQEEQVKEAKKDFGELMNGIWELYAKALHDLSEANARIEELEVYLSQANSCEKEQPDEPT